MDLVQIHIVRLQPPEAVLELAHKVEARGAAAAGPGAAHKPGLGGQHGLMPPAGQRFADNPLRFGAGVDVGRVDEVDAAVKRGVQHGRGGRLIRPLAKGVGAESKL
ncbi:hypothetical protein D3C71_1366570 [compost metagenome]